MRLQSIFRAVFAILLGLFSLTANDAQSETLSDLLTKFNCGYCHTLPSSTAQPSRRKSCLGCHQAVLNGELDSSFGKSHAQKLKESIRSLVVSPEFAPNRQLLKPEWVKEFLLRPIAVRPHLGAFMPRFPMTESEATTIAFGLYGSSLYVSSLSVNSDTNSSSQTSIVVGDAKIGRQLLSDKGCLGCHLLSPAPNASQLVPQRETPNSVRLAPDLSLTKFRLTADSIALWLKDPKAVLPNTTMPKPELSQRELADVTAAILQLEDAPPFEQISLPLKPLERKVSFSEVRTRVLDRVCRHCHTDERKTGGEAGAGNTGGFGYPGKGLDLSSESGIKRGVLDSSSGKRVSVISANSGELPLVVRTLVARHSELRGEFNSGVTGMPLGFAPIAEEDIRVIYTWCLQEGES